MKVATLLLFIIFIISCNTVSEGPITKSKNSIKEYLSKNLDDYSSYEPVDYHYDTSRKYSPGWRVEHTFRSKNKFGAIVLSDFYFNLDSNFKVVNIEGGLEGYHFNK